MAGHMNVLLGEAKSRTTASTRWRRSTRRSPATDIVLVVGANDVTNPAAKQNTRPGFAGVDNDLYYDEKCMMLFGDAKESMTKLSLPSVPARHADVVTACRNVRRVGRMGSYAAARFG
jgi:NAD(P) transhydrogenase subunit beta